MNTHNVYYTWGRWLDFKEIIMVTHTHTHTHTHTRASSTYNKLEALSIKIWSVLTTIIHEPLGQWVHRSIPTLHHVQCITMWTHTIACCLPSPANTPAPDSLYSCFTISYQLQPTWLKVILRVANYMWSCSRSTTAVPSYNKQSSLILNSGIYLSKIKLDCHKYNANQKWPCP